MSAIACRCVITTPLGAPVDPDVKMMTSGSRPLRSAAAATGAIGAVGRGDRARLGDEGTEREDRAPVRHEGRGLRRVRLVRDHVDDAGQVHDVAQSRLGQERVERDDRAPGTDQAEQGQHRLDAVRHEHTDGHGRTALGHVDTEAAVVVRRQALVEQHAGGTRHPVELTVGQGEVLVRHREGVRQPCGDVGQPRQERRLGHVGATVVGQGTRRRARPCWRRRVGPGSGGDEHVGVPFTVHRRSVSTDRNPGAEPTDRRRRTRMREPAERCDMPQWPTTVRAADG